LTNSVALVTGGAGRLGRAICTALAREGARIGVVDRSTTAGDVARQLEGDGYRASGVQTDVSDPVQVERMLQQVTDALGPVDEAVVFLAGRNNSWMTGAILPVTGGSHCGRTHVPLSRGLR
jgi:NAD(P)-dependent dehydrogenase (short-subunit alcohol dehydrogenase family)